MPEPAAASLPRWRLAALLAGPAACALLLALTPPAGMPPEAWRLVALAAWMVVWWLSEALPVAATALLPILAMPLLDIEPIAEVTQNYSHPLIFLFLGGFLMAIAMQRVDLHRRLALMIVGAVGSDARRIVLGFMLATAFLSMWISNTAATIMMFAVGLSVIDIAGAGSRDREAARRFGIALMLGICYAASIGGVGTLIGSPPNALLATFLSGEYGIRIDFFHWMLIGLPVVAVMLPLAWLYLTRVLLRGSPLDTAEALTALRAELQALGPMRRAEWAVALVFLAAAAAWGLRLPLVSLTGLPISDTAVALAAALLLFLLPLAPAPRHFILDWQAAKDLPWGVLLLFGGGLALAGGFKSSGLAAWIGGAVGGVEIETWLLVLAVVAAIVFLTELTSNTASTATFLPIMAAVAVGLGLDPRMLTVPVALGASMAFMMPVATPPNAIVFSYEELHLKDMAKAGIAMNLLAVAVVLAATYLLVYPFLGP